MIPNTFGSRPFRSSTFPVGRALVESRVSPGRSIFKGWRPSKNIRRAAQIATGIRRAKALLKRLQACKMHKIVERTGSLTPPSSMNDSL